MNATIFLIIVFVVFLVLAARIIFRHLADLKNLDVKSLAQEQQKTAKAKILQAKLSRQGQKIKSQLDKVFFLRKNFFSDRLNKLKSRVAELEAQYNGDAAENEENKTAAELFQLAESQLAQEEYVLAEKNLIKIISQDAKDIRAYEMLGDLYLANKNYDQAEEIFKYLIRLFAVGGRTPVAGKDRLEEAETDLLTSLEVHPKLATYYDDLSKIYELAGKNDKALDASLKAASIEPNNPKYLDRMIDFGIKVGDKGLAKKTYNRLKLINPENAKLEELKAAIEKMK